MAVPTPTLSSEGKHKLDEVLAEQVKNGNVPALFFGATNAKEELYFDCGGKSHLSKDDSSEVDPDTTLQLFSMTKFITTVVCLQLVDEGLVTLDDPEVVEKYCPELKDLPILESIDENGKESTRPKKNRITLRMLLAHTAGFAYAFSSPLYEPYLKAHKHKGFFESGVTYDDYALPVVFEPGTAWLYGINVDWAGAVVHRVLGKSLEDIYQERIFKPCGMTSCSFYPTENIASRLMEMTARDGPNGKVISLPGAAMNREMDPKKVGPALMAGGGLFGTARDYLSFLRHVLASADPENPKPLISAKSFREAFVDNVRPRGADDQYLIKSTTEQNVNHPGLYETGGKDIGFGLGLFLNHIDSGNGRKAGSGAWDGAAKTYFWIDPKTGVAGVCCTNILAANPDPMNKTYNAYERALYDSLA